MSPIPVIESYEPVFGVKNEPIATKNVLLRGAIPVKTAISLGPTP